MKHVHIFQKDTVEAQERVRELRVLGYKVTHGPISPGVLKKLREEPPAAVLIDLSRAPSMGRDVGIYIRHYRVTRSIPIVFFGGEPDKVSQIKEHLPDAEFTDRHRIRTALKRAISRPPTAPVKPQSLLAGYSRTPLVKKLGIKAEFSVVLIDAPHDFQKSLGKMPQGVVMKQRLTRRNDMVVWFVRSRKALEQRMSKVADFVKQGGLWIVWPKRTSRIPSDLSQKHVRAVGLNAGLVDYKVCAIDETWSGLKFALRK